MRLVSCHIAHFGKIADFRYDFEDGFNAIIHDNGWGKTTFSVFVKAMFFGLDYSPNTKKKLMERTHYLPWDGSLCGGNIVFEIKDRTYRIERTFGKTDKSDTFVLFDQQTGLESDDYSENIGEEIFKVDRDSFEKSVYIPQLSINTAMTDSLNAQMGNLASAKDDISNFDVALKAVKDARIEFVRNSKINPGKLHAVKDEINNYKEELEKLPGVMEGFNGVCSYLEEKQERLEELQAKKTALVEQIQTQSKMEQELGAYKSYKEDLKKEQEKLDFLDEFFSGGIPDIDELQALEQTDRDLDVHTRAFNAIVEEQKKGLRVFGKPFEERVPDEGEFAMWNKMATSLSELRAKAEHAKLSDDAARQLSDLKFFFTKGVPTDEELSELEKKAATIASIDGMLGQAYERVAAIKSKNEAERKQKQEEIGVGSIIAAVLAILLLATGIIFNNFNDNGLGILVEKVAFIAAFVDIIILIAVRRFIIKKRDRREDSYEDNLASAEQNLQDLKDQKLELTSQCQQFLANFEFEKSDASMLENVYEIRRKLDQYIHLLEEEDAHRQASAGTLDELADLQLELYTKIQPFATAYGINLYDMGEEFDFLNQLKRDADKYSNYLVEIEDMARHENCIRTLTEEIEKALERYPVNREATYDEQIHEISANVNKYNSILSRIDEIQDKISQVESKTVVNESAMSVDELQQQQAEVDAAIVDLNKLIMQDKENLSSYAEELERLSDIQEQLERLDVLAGEYKEKTELLGLTADFLQKARASFLSKYMGPLQTGLHKYLEMIELSEGTESGYALTDFELDMDLNIKLNYFGNTKTAEYLSQGYQDLIALCSRLALVDVLYSEEKPLLILDDPFSNLDDAKIKESLKLLKKISKERQVIYFTCHESRI